MCIILIAVLASSVMTASSVFSMEADDSVAILFTHDLHDNFYPFELAEEGKSTSVGGYARLFTAIQKEREKEPGSLLIDAGDYSMGTLFQTINTIDAPELRIMGQMGYDVTTLGNHEFDYRPEGLTKSLRAALESGEELPQIVASNTIFPEADNEKMTPSLQALKDAMDDYGVKDSLVIERAGLKIGFIGLMGDEAATDSPMAEVAFGDIIESSKERVATLKDEEGVDLVIALSHSGTSEDPSVSEDELLAKGVPDLDVIISGHSHTVLDEPIIVGDTIIVSSGEYGKNLGTLKIKGSIGDWKVENYDIIPINDQLQEDPEIAKQVDQYKELVQKEYLDNFDMEFDEVLAYSPFSFTPFSELGKTHEETMMGNLIGDAFIHSIREIEGSNYEPITASIVPVGTIRDSFVEGDITVSDVFNVSPLGIGANGVAGYPLVNIYLTGKDLKTVAEVDASITPIMSDVQLYISGLRYTFNPNRLIFNKVTEVQLENTDGTYSEIEKDKLYRVVAGLYSAQMLPIVKDKSFSLLSVVPRDKDGTPIEDFEAEIIHRNEDNEEELKEWFALASYLQSFDEMDGQPQVPAYYEETHHRKVVDDHTNLFAIIKNPNGIAIGAFSIVIVVLGGLTLLITWLVKKRKRKKALQLK